MKKILATCISLFLCIASYATHQVAGYIAVKWISGYTYQVTIYDYTNTYPINVADRDTMSIWYEDGGVKRNPCYRINGLPNYLLTGDPYPNGEALCNYDFRTATPTPLYGARKVSIYQTTITFLGPGSYKVWMDDPDRMVGINNILGSVNVDYYMYSVITVTDLKDLPTGTGISSLLITNTPVCQYGCVGQCYTYNPGAYVPNLPAGVADSIGYSLSNCLELINPNNQLSVGIANNYYNPGATIDDSGTFRWCPQSLSDTGIWNFAITMVTYVRMYSDLGGFYSMEAIDTTEMELEIIINSACYTPTVTSIDTCVTAGNNISITYTASVPDASPLYISASGQPFQESPPATLSNYTPPFHLMHPVLNWQTTCSEVSTIPYEAVIKATEKITQSPSNDSAFYSGYGITHITVIAPAPQHLTAINKGTTVCLSWQSNGCPQDTIYNIYRRKGCSGWKPQYCEAGVPSYTGYVLIATVHGVTSYCDSNGGAGLSPGVSYNYIVDAALPPTNGAQSYASNDTCLTIKLGVPLIKNVSVTKTDPKNGEIYIRWMKPIADSNDLDTTQYLPPYKYILERAPGMNGTHFSTLATYTTSVFKTTIDSTYSDMGLDTKDSSYTYRVDFYNGIKDTFIGSSGNASSIYLRLNRDNKSMHMGWAVSVPWTNDTFYIYRQGTQPTYQLVGKTTNTTYTDMGLHNGSTYCYYVESYSEYTGASHIPKPLFDSSETICGTPEDTIPPCPPPLAVIAKCALYDDSLIWSNPGWQCPNANKVVGYQIYYSPFENGDMHIIDTIDNPEDTIFVNNHLTSVAGCYAVVAIDSAGQTSPLNTQCVDNCPIYELPNVFTPNGDGINDLFTPLASFRFIQGIDINIYNRWGQVVYHTTDPNINWNGNVNNSGEPCPDGVYYYICNVNEIRVTGIESVALKGFIQLIRN